MSITIANRSNSSSTATSSVTPRHQVRKNGLDVLPEEDGESLGGVEEAPTQQRMLSENKLMQTDLTYGKANKRIQVEP